MRLLTLALVGTVVLAGAWLRLGHGDADHAEVVSDPATSAWRAVKAPPWMMTVGDDINCENYMGEKEDLIQIDREAGVPDEASRVYHRAARDYVPIG